MADIDPRLLVLKEQRNAAMDEAAAALAGNLVLKQRVGNLEKEVEELKQEIEQLTQREAHE